MRLEIIYTEEFPPSPRPVINIDGVFKAANHTYLIFIHTAQGIQHTLLVGSSLRNF